jgi:hypothetical protein
MHCLGLLGRIMNTLMVKSKLEVFAYRVLGERNFNSKYDKTESIFFGFDVIYGWKITLVYFML